ncbi:MAG: ATP-binding protein [Gammaproteobacteria bacterium]
MGHSGSLKRLLLRHELALLLLVVVTVALGGAWGYVWQQASRESVRLNNQIHIALQVRSDLYRQIKEVTEARLTEDPRALELYQQYSRRIARHLNAMRGGTVSRDEEMAIQRMGLAYRVIQQDMNRSFIDPFAINAAARLKILDRRYEELLLADFEKALGSYLDLLNAQREALMARLARYSNWARIVIPLPILLAVALFAWSRASIRRGFVRPVAEVISGALKMSQGQLDHRIPEQGAEEMANLARAINGMARDLAASRDALVEKERQAALGALVPVVAHNIRNPLASIRATAQMIDEQDRPEDVGEARQAIIQTVDRLERWVRSLLSYLHPLQPRRSKVRLRRVVEGALVLLQPRLEEKGVTVTSRGWEIDPEVSLDVDLAEQAVYGLLTNAVDASPVGATITVRLGRADARWRLGIEDEGPGMPFDPQPHGLTPGPTTKRSGTGLGIPFAYKVCQAHGWGLEFTPRPGGGTVAAINIPMTEQAYVEHP